MEVLVIQPPPHPNADQGEDYRCQGDGNHQGADSELDLTHSLITVKTLFMPTILYLHIVPLYSRNFLKIASTW
jgi:hypothetical protein